MTHTMLEISRHMMENGNFKMALVEAFPNTAFIRIYNTLTNSNIHLQRLENGFYLLQIGEKTYQLVRPQNALRLTHIGTDPINRVYNRYTINGKYEPKSGDKVVDIGSFIGEFSMGVEQNCNSGEIVAIEPDPRSYHCTDYNANAHIIRIAVGSYHGTTDINVAADPTETGILQPDKGSSNKHKIEIMRLEHIFTEIDYLKVEAEGYEPEVLEGLGGLEPHTISVNVSAERNGESPIEMCQDILIDKGYVMREFGTHLIAKK